MASSNVFVSYDHTIMEFKEMRDPVKFEKILQSDIMEIGAKLDALGMDGILIFNRQNNRWNLIFAKHLGLVAQRTARRQADTISRSGFMLFSGERVGRGCPLEQLSADNIGDLSKSVQQKYISTDLSGFHGDSRQN